MKSPCRECGKRKVGCHGGCDDYRAWRAERDEKTRKADAERQGTPMLCRAVQRQIWRGMKGR